MEKKYQIVETKTKSDFWMNYIGIFIVCFIIESMFYLGVLGMLSLGINLDVSNAAYGGVILIVINSLIIGSISAKSIEEIRTIETTKEVTLKELKGGKNRPNGNN